MCKWNNYMYMYINRTLLHVSLVQPRLTIYSQHRYMYTEVHLKNVSPGQLIQTGNFGFYDCGAHCLHRLHKNCSPVTRGKHTNGMHQYNGKSNSYIPGDSFPESHYNGRVGVFGRDHGCSPKLGVRLLSRI